MKSWFQTPYLLTVRPVPGGEGLALLVENGPEFARGRLWDGKSAGEISEILPFPVGLGAALTKDGRWVVELDDNGGSEVGHLWARSVDGNEALDLTPDLPSYVLRGLEPSADGSALLATIVDDEGFHVIVVPMNPWRPARRIYSSPCEAWYAHISADGSLVSIDTTSHNPNVRRPAVTVVDVASAEPIGVLNDLPAGPIRAIRFSPDLGDPRVLVSTERSGFARPCIWNPATGERQDFDLPHLNGDVMPLDWHAATGSVLAVHVDGGIQQLLRCYEATGEAEVVSAGMGSYADPDVADVYAWISNSYFNPDGTIAAVTSTWALPLHITHLAAGARRRCSSHPLTSPWVGRSRRSWSRARTARACSCGGLAPKASRAAPCSKSTAARTSSRSTGSPRPHSRGWKPDSPMPR